MKTTIKLELSQGQITEVKMKSKNQCEFVVESSEPVQAKVKVIDNKEEFVLVEASKLSLEDRFMKHNPRTENEKEFKDLLTQIIVVGIKDFWRPRLDPSFNEAKNRICYVSGQKPAVGKSYNWWKKTTSEYIPKCGSRLGTKSEYVAFLGVLIKSLISEGWTVSSAWDAVCNDSKQLGHYCNSENAKYDFESTGSREVCGFFDLANTYKILAEDKEAGFWLAGGCCRVNGNCSPLAVFFHYYGQDLGYNDSVGWLVLEKGSADH